MDRKVMVLILSLLVVFLSCFNSWANQDCPDKGSRSRGLCRDVGLNTDSIVQQGDKCYACDDWLCRREGSGVGRVCTEAEYEEYRDGDTSKCTACYRSCEKPCGSPTPDTTYYYDKGMRVKGKGGADEIIAVYLDSGKSDMKFQGNDGNTYAVALLEDKNDPNASSARVYLNGKTWALRRCDPPITGGKCANADIISAGTGISPE